MLLSVSQISKKYDDQQVLNKVSFEIEKNMVMALCGASGSGKTTLARIISGLIPFDAGTLTIDGTTIQSKDSYPSSLYGKIGVIFQEHNLFPHMTVLQNITIGLIKVRKFTKEDATKRAAVELENMGLGDKAQQYPAFLSGGERQRVAIARALAMDPFLLLLDEPTSGLDPLRIEDVFQTILQLAKSNTTMLLITHHLELASAAADMYSVIDNGTLSVSQDSSLLDTLKGSFSSSQ